MSERRPDPGDQFLGNALFAVGVLIFGLCGLCTGTFALYGLTGVVASGDFGAIGQILLLIGIVGGLPTLGGFLLMRAGWRLSRRPAKPKAEPKAFD